MSISTRDRSSHGPLLHRTRLHLIPPQTAPRDQLLVFTATHTITTRTSVAQPCMADDEIVEQEVDLGCSTPRSIVDLLPTDGSGVLPSHSVRRSWGTVAQRRVQPSTISAYLQSRHHIQLTHPAARSCRDRCHPPLRARQTCRPGGMSITFGVWRKLWRLENC